MGKWKYKKDYSSNSEVKVDSLKIGDVFKYKKFNDAYNASFYPGCKLVSTDTVLFSTDNYYEVVRALKFIL